MTERDPRVAALIEAMKPIEVQRATEERPHEWSDREVAAIYDNGEVKRLTSEPPVNSEVQRLLDSYGDGSA